MEPWKDSCCSSNVQGERHQRRLAIRREETGHVSKLFVETLFISENFYS